MSFGKHDALDCLRVQVLYMDHFFDVDVGVASVVQDESAEREGEDDEQLGGKALG